MEAFSFRRMMLFCRLQMVEMYGRNIGRTLRVGAAAVLVICLFSLIFGEEGESVSVAERMMVVCSFVASVGFLQRPGGIQDDGPGQPGGEVCVGFRELPAAERDVPRAVGARGFGFLHA